MRKSISLLTVGAMLALGLQFGAMGDGEEGCLVSKINAERQGQGAAPLAVNSDLVAIARKHSAEMSAAGRWYHNANLRNELPSGWKYEGENVGWATDCGYMDNFFINSPPHRANILNPTFHYIGVGVVTDSTGKLWVTEVFMQGNGGQSNAAGASNTPAQTQPPVGAPAPSPAKATPKPGGAPPASPSQLKASLNPPPATGKIATSTRARARTGPRTLAYEDLIENEPESSAPPIWDPKDEITFKL